jgi:Ran GTPase-activating protein (RanGAP) involved in mRNA processing and transport
MKRFQSFRGRERRRPQVKDETDSYSLSSDDSEEVTDDDNVLISHTEEDDESVSSSSDESESSASGIGYDNHFVKAKSTNTQVKLEGDIFAHLMSNHRSLKEIDIDETSISKSLATDIAEALPKNTYLTKLRLISSRGLEEKMNHSIFNIIVSGLGRNSYITTIEIMYATISRDTANALGRALARNEALKKICLSNCDFVTTGLSVLFMGMQHNKSIEDVTIRSCDLGNSASDIVAASLPLMKPRCLTLEHTNIGNDGLRFLFDNVLKNDNLRELSLSGNQLDKDSIKLLASCLKSPQQKLDKLDLSSCGLNYACIRAFSNGLRLNPTLAKIDLSENEFGDEGALVLKRLLITNNSILELKIEKCNITDARLEKAIVDGLRYNNSFLKSMFSEQISLSIMESVDMIREVGGSTRSIF